MATETIMMIDQREGIFREGVMAMYSVYQSVKNKPVLMHRLVFYFSPLQTLVMSAVSAMIVIVVIISAVAAMIIVII